MAKTFDKIDPKGLLERVISGETRAMARMMSYAESKRPEHRKQLAQVYNHTGKAHVVGITGVPGSGKSTLVCAITQLIRTSGRRVGIVAIDPSSPFSGGAILGDRIRMAELATDDGVFIRSVATRGSMGGLARAALGAADVLDVAGFDIVLVETVGVGQDGVDIAGAAHTVIVVSPPGLGDDIQAIKAGILEIADIHVASKCDRADAVKTKSDLESMLGLGLTGRASPEWSIPVIATSSETNEGLEGLVGAIDEHRIHLKTSGEMCERERNIVETRVLKMAQEIMSDGINAQGTNGNFGPLLKRVASREIDPVTAAYQILKNLDLEA